VAVAPAGIEVGEGAFGSNIKAYIHFCFEILLKDAKLIKRVNAFVSGALSDGIWKKGSRSKKKSSQEEK
jgi:hypothetical protein